MGGRDAGDVAPLQGSGDHWDWQERQDKLFAGDAPPTQPGSSSGAVVAAPSSEERERVLSHASESSVLHQVQEDVGPFKLLKGFGKEVLGLFGVLIGGVPKLASALLIAGLLIAAAPLSLVGGFFGGLFHPIINAIRDKEEKKGMLEDVVTGYKFLTELQVVYIFAGWIPLAITSGFEYVGSSMQEKAGWKEEGTPSTLLGKLFEKEMKMFFRTEITEIKGKDTK